MLKSKHVSAGTRVRVATPGPVPAWSTWECDSQRTSTAVKRRLQQLYFNGDRRVSAEVVYVSSEHERDRLRRSERVKVQLRDAAGSTVVITACANNIRQA